MDMFQVSIERTRNFCSFQVTRFVTGNLFVEKISNLLETLYKVLSDLYKFATHILFKINFICHIMKENLVDNSFDENYQPHVNNALKLFLAF